MATEIEAIKGRLYKATTRELMAPRMIALGLNTRKDSTKKNGKVIKNNILKGKLEMWNELIDLPDPQLLGQIDEEVWKKFPEYKPQGDAEKEEEYDDMPPLHYENVNVNAKDDPKYKALEARTLELLKQERQKSGDVPAGEEEEEEEEEEEGKEPDKFPDMVLLHEQLLRDTKKNMEYLARLAQKKRR